jgi:hypothetical protein
MKEIVMADCRFVTKEMLSNPIGIRADDESLDYYRARSLADQAAREVDSDNMLVSWFDKKAGKYSPDIICCDTEKPTWLVYAESHGGNITVEVNDLDYVFVYAGGVFNA